MTPEFRQRVFLPVVLPLVIVLGFVGFAFSLSRVLLAVSEALATFIALAVAGYILLVAGLISARPRISSRALGAGLVLALVAVAAAGAVGATAGMRELHPETEAAAGAPADDGEGAAVPADGLEFVAVDIDYAEAPSSAPAGELTFVLVNDGGILHDVTIVELGDEVVVEATGGETNTGAVTLDPGDYTYYCSVPGHRDAGMEGTLEVG